MSAIRRRSSRRDSVGERRRGAEAAETALGQVRDRNLRAAAAWQAMADKLERAETARAEREEAVAKLRAAAS